MSIEPSSPQTTNVSPAPSKQPTAKSWLSSTISFATSVGSSALAVTKSVASTALTATKTVIQHPLTQSVAKTAVSIGGQAVKTTVAASAHVLGKVIEKGTAVAEKIAEIPAVQSVAKTTKDVITTTAQVAYGVGIVAAYTAKEAIVFTAKKLVLDPEKIRQEKEKAKKTLDEKMKSTSLGQSAHFLSLYATEYLKSIFQKDTSFTTSLAQFGIEMSSDVMNDIIDLNLTLALTRMVTNLENYQKSNPSVLADVLSSLFKNTHQELTSPSKKNTTSKEVSQDVSALLLEWAFPGGAKDLSIPGGYLLDAATSLIQEKLFNELKTTIFPKIFSSTIDSFLYKNQTRDKILNMLIRLIDSSLDNLDFATDSRPPQKSTLPAAPEDFQKTALTLSQTLLNPLLEGLPFKETIRKKIETGIQAELPQLWHKLTCVSLPELFQTTMEQTICGLFWGEWKTAPHNTTNTQQSPQPTLRSFQRDESKPLEFFTTQKQWDDYYKKLDQNQASLNAESLKTLQGVQEKIYKKANIPREIVINEFKKQIGQKKIETNFRMLMYSVVAFFLDFLVWIAKKQYGENLSFTNLYKSAQKFESSRTLSIASSALKQKKEAPHD